MGQFMAKLSVMVVWVAASLQPVYGRSPLPRLDAMVDDGGQSVMRRSLLLDSINLDDADKLFKGRISMKAGDNGTSRWRIYQRLGMGGVWGAATENDYNLIFNNWNNGK